MEFWRQKFLELFEVSHLMLDLMDEVSDELLYDFMITKITDEYTKKEILENLLEEMDKTEAVKLIKELNFK